MGLDKIVYDLLNFWIMLDISVFQKEKKNGLG